MYRLRPKLKLNNHVHTTEGLKAIGEHIKAIILRGNYSFTALESYPGIEVGEFESWFKDNFPEALVMTTDSLYVDEVKVTGEIHKDLTDDIQFGKFSNDDFVDFLNPLAYKDFREHSVGYEHLILIGVGSSQIIQADLTVYLDISRWKIQQRFKVGLKNWKGLHEKEFNQKLKRAYYFEWPAGDSIKDRVLAKSDYYIDMNLKDQPKMIKGSSLISILEQFTVQPFRLVPYFDSGVWGGDWMQEKFNVGQDKVNLAWCFDGVPEENSLLASDGKSEIEIPAYNLITLLPMELLGAKVFGRYGRDYPIRFNFLDTMNGQNLSLQVHPTFDYARRKFRAKYTQDESYYILDGEEDAVVYVGVKNSVTKAELVEKFEEAATTGLFDDEQYINQIPVKKHDHILIPGGTIHSSGKNAVVLEISATPNRFTFKLWDWRRLDLNGKPRPISIEHGSQVINEAVDTDYVYKELFNRTYEIQSEEQFKEEHTGLHQLEAIETRRLTFSKEITQSTCDSPNTLNLVEGSHIQVLAVANEFEPFDVYYGETFIIPASVKEYRLKPLDGEAIVMKAYIR